MMFPANAVAFPSVADDPTCQKTLQACAPLMRTTLDAGAVVSADPIWNKKSEFGMFCPSNTRSPAKFMDAGVV
jgi:hypothetical protein